VAIWLFALVTLITVAVLFKAKVVGSWALVVASLFSAALALHRYQAETEQKKRNADDQ
jgi:hypothetical protein